MAGFSYLKTLWEGRQRAMTAVTLLCCQIFESYDRAPLTSITNKNHTYFWRVLAVWKHCGRDDKGLWPRSHSCAGKFESYDRAPLTSITNKNHTYFWRVSAIWKQCGRDDKGLWPRSHSCADKFESYDRAPLTSILNKMKEKFITRKRKWT